MAKKAETKVEAKAPEPSESELKQRADAAMNARSQACAEEIKAACKKYNCAVVTRPKIEAGRVYADWGVQALE